MSQLVGDDGEGTGTKAVATPKKGSLSALLDSGVTLAQVFEQDLMTAVALAAMDPGSDRLGLSVSDAIVTGMNALKLADPIEAILAAQLLASNNAALRMHERATGAKADVVEERYLGMADRMTRSVIRIVETLDKRRGQTPSPQQAAQNVTVHADQAVVAGQIVTAR